VAKYLFVVLAMLLAYGFVAASIVCGWDFGQVTDQVWIMGVCHD